MVKQKKTSPVSKVIWWIVGIFFLLAGLASFSDSIFSGILFVLGGVFILPPFQKWISDKYNFKTKIWIKVTVVVGVLIIGSGFSSDTNEDQINNEDIAPLDNSQVVTCTSTWQCGDWSECSSSSNQIRTCSDVNNCGDVSDKPSESQSCTHVVAEPEPEPEPEPEEEPDKATMGEKNALAQALSYLDYSAFSREGLIDQLEYEGYAHQEAVYGVDNSGANWYEQATLKAQSYLDYSAFSREGLIEQLEYEGFTREQAEYGVQAVGY